MKRFCSLSLLEEAFLGFFFAFSAGSCEGLGGGGREEDECRDARRDSTRPAKVFFVFCFKQVNSLDQSIVASTLIKIMNAGSHSEWYWVIWSFMELLSFVAAIFVGDVLNITNWNQRWDSCDTLRILRHEVRDPRIFAPSHTWCPIESFSYFDSMIIWLDVPWNPNRMMYAIVKWSRPFFASIAKCGSMAQHSGILGRSIGRIRTSCGFEDVRRVEMGWDGFFVSPDDFHHCQHEPPKPIGRVNVQLADFVVFPHHFTMIGEFRGFVWINVDFYSLGHFNHTEVGWSRDWQEAPQSGATRSGQLQRTFRSIFLWRVLWRVPLGANGCHFCIFLSCFRASMKILGSLKKATITRPRVFFGDQKTMSEEFSPKWTSKMR